MLHKVVMSMVVVKMKNIVNYSKTRFNNDLRKYDLTASQYVVLKYLINNEGKKNIQKDIRMFLVLKHTTVVGIIQRLEEKNLIKRESKRASLITVTSKGKKLYESIGDYESKLNKEILRSLNKDEKEKLYELINKIYSDIFKEV